MDERLSGAIIAAGKGERLRIATEGLAKPLVRIIDETLLERQARLLAAAGAAPINVIINSETARLMAEAPVLSFHARAFLESPNGWRGNTVTQSGEEHAVPDSTTG